MSNYTSVDQVNNAANHTIAPKYKPSLAPKPKVNEAHFKKSLKAQGASKNFNNSQVSQNIQHNSQVNFKKIEIATPSTFDPNNLDKIKNPDQNQKNGTNLALRKELRETSVKLAQYFVASMWKFAYDAAKDPESKDMTHTLFSGRYIEEIVRQAYGEDGGPLAEAMYEKLILEQGLKLDE